MNDGEEPERTERSAVGFALLKEEFEDKMKKEQQKFDGEQAKRAKKVKGLEQDLVKQLKKGNMKEAAKHSAQKDIDEAKEEMTEYKKTFDAEVAVKKKEILFLFGCRYRGGTPSFHCLKRVPRSWEH